MTETGWLPYDLADNFCEECGRAKSLRLWPGTLTGCATCDDIVTRHRCMGRPDLDDLALGVSWTCPDCGTVWTVTEEAAFCSECGCSECRTEKRWTVSVPGDRLGTAPRYRPQPFTPFRNPFRSSLAAAYTPPGPFGDCYQTASGMAVHVRPGCRCKT